MKITYIIGPIDASKSTLLDCFQKQIPEGVQVRYLGRVGGPQLARAVKRAGNEAKNLTLFIDEPTPEAWEVLDDLYRQKSPIRVVVAATLDDVRQHARLYPGV